MITITDKEFTKFQESNIDVVAMLNEYVMSLDPEERVRLLIALLFKFRAHEMF